MNMRYTRLLLSAFVITIVSFIIVQTNIAFLLLKAITVPFVPSRNIDQMSDYYTAVWKSVNKKANDNDRFTIIDVTGNSRKEIVDILSAIKEMNPRIIGLDVNFINSTEADSIVDSLLIHTLQSIPNLVLPVEYYTNDNNNAFLYSIYHQYLYNKEYGVVSFPNNRDILRTHCPFFHNGQDTLYSFAYIIAKKFSKTSYQIRYSSDELINYTTLRLGDEHAQSGDEYLNMNSRDSAFIASQISNRIVLLGCTRDTEDQHLTPLGYNLSGVMVHANIINSLIENKSINPGSQKLRYLLCFILAFFLLKRYQNNIISQSKNHKLWLSILYYIIVFIFSVFIFSVLGTFFFCKVNYYIDFAPYIVTFIIVSVTKHWTLNIKEHED